MADVYDARREHCGDESVQRLAGTGASRTQHRYPAFDRGGWGILTCGSAQVSQPPGQPPAKARRKGADTVISSAVRFSLLHCGQLCGKIRLLPPIAGILRPDVYMWTHILDFLLRHARFTIPLVIPIVGVIGGTLSKLAIELFELVPQRLRSAPPPVPPASEVEPGAGTEEKAASDQAEQRKRLQVQERRRFEWMYAEGQRARENRTRLNTRTERSRSESAREYQAFRFQIPPIPENIPRPRTAAAATPSKRRSWGLLSIAIIMLALFVVLSRKDVKAKVATAGLGFPPPLCNMADAKSLLVFIHGWAGDPKETWKEFPQLVCDDPEFRTVEVVVVNYPTYFARRNAEIMGLADWVNEEIEKADKNEHYAQIVLIAHSMGGLIGREVAILGKLKNQKPAGLLVEIATPHQGANVAGLASALGISEKLTKEMLNDSSTLNSLTTQWSAFADRPTTYCFTSPDDSVVSLQSAMFGCDRSMTYPLWSHTEMVKPPKSDDPRYVEPIGIVQKFIATKSSPTPR